MKNNPNSGVDFKSITFCSFDHEALIELKKQAHKKNPRIAPAIRTTLLFGDENVDKKNGFKVKPGAKYQE